MVFLVIDFWIFFVCVLTNLVSTNNSVGLNSQFCSSLKVNVTLEELQEMRYDEVEFKKRNVKFS